MLSYVFGYILILFNIVLAKLQTCFNIVLVILQCCFSVPNVYCDLSIRHLALYIRMEISAHCIMSGTVFNISPQVLREHVKFKIINYLNLTNTSQDS